METGNPWDFIPLFLFYPSNKMESCFLLLNFYSLCFHSACSVLIFKYSLTYWSHGGWVLHLIHGEILVGSHSESFVVESATCVTCLNISHTCHNYLRKSNMATCKIIVIWLKVVYIDVTVIFMLCCA